MTLVMAKTIVKFRLEIERRKERYVPTILHLFYTITDSISSRRTIAKVAKLSELMPTTDFDVLRQERLGAGMADQKDLDAQYARAVMGIENSKHC
jgi:hypothetical protein